MVKRRLLLCHDLVAQVAKPGEQELQLIKDISYDTKCLLQVRFLPILAERLLCLVSIVSHERLG